MKVGILTHYNASSHGALLQMYALKRTLEDMGHEVFVLEYQRNFDFIDEQTRNRFGASLRNIKYYLLSYLPKNGLSTLLFQFRKQKYLGKFRSENFQMTSYVNSKDLDCVVVGADEVFSLENGVNAVMFGHGVTSKRLLSYAPSFGQTDIQRIRRFGCEDLIASGLGRYDALSVRDEGSQRTVLALTGREVSIVCDPALLYDFGQIQKGTCGGKRYMVVYSYQSNFTDPERIRAIQAYAKKNNCELWSVGVHFKWCKRKINCTPLEMLQVFANAEAVITDTFHGTISSYIARTPVAVFVRENNNVKLDHLLTLIGYGDRKVTNPQELEAVLSRQQDFSQADARVAELRQKGMAYLKENLI